MSTRSFCESSMDVICVFMLAMGCEKSIDVILGKKQCHACSLVLAQSEHWICQDCKFSVTMI
jgi:hypothetical protein